MMISNEILNIEREKANLLCLIKLTLNTLIDQSLSSTTLPVLDDRNTNVTNFILTLERLFNFRMRANWLSERRSFWDFIRPACMGSSRQIIERVEVLKTRSIKDKGRAWIKFALMEKKLSQLLKVILSDSHLLRKYYHDDSIMTSSHAFILSDQLTGLTPIDFSFCFKQDESIHSSLLNNHFETDVIDLTPFLSYKSKYIKQLFEDEENKEPIRIFSTINELKPLNLSEHQMITFEKYKLELEQRKYFEDLFKIHDQELQQFKIRFQTFKNERENEIIELENIVLELQIQLKTSRDEAEFKRKKSQQSTSIISSKSLFYFSIRKLNSPTSTTTTNDYQDNDSDIDTQMRPMEGLFITDNYQSIDINEKLNSRHSKIKPISSPQIISSPISLSISSLSTDDDGNDQSHQNIIHESGRFQPLQITNEQVNLLEEEANTNT